MERRTPRLTYLHARGPEESRSEAFSDENRPLRCTGLEENFMCRNIRTLFNFNPPATEEEIQGASLQFVRKLSGSSAPSKANEKAFNHAVEEVSVAARNLLNSLVTSAKPRNREFESMRAHARAVKRFSSS